MTIENLQKQVEELNEKISTLPETEENKAIINEYKNRIELIEKEKHTCLSERGANNYPEWHNQKSYWYLLYNLSFLINY